MQAFYASLASAGVTDGNSLTALVADDLTQIVDGDGELITGLRQRIFMNELEEWKHAS
jgi:hypothetical protein